MPSPLSFQRGRCRAGIGALDWGCAAILGTSSGWFRRKKTLIEENMGVGSSVNRQV